MCKAKQEIKLIVERYKNNLKNKINSRIIEMNTDNFDHYLIYNLLGITNNEGKLIDEYQNVGRFLYRYAGSLLEEVTKFCFSHTFSEKCKLNEKINNTVGIKPKTFEIDCLVENKAYEIKWRDATTDGDHITKEHTRIQVISDKGYIPIRIMYYYPNREQAQRIQSTLETLYKGIGGEYYRGDVAWDYVHELTKINLLKILKDISLGN